MLRIVTKDGYALIIWTASS